MSKSWKKSRAEIIESDIGTEWTDTDSARKYYRPTIRYKYTFEMKIYENDNYNYEKGAFSLIKFTWDDADKKLTIDHREGSFDGMLENHTFHLVFIDAQNESQSKTVEYKGKMLELNIE